MHVDIYAQLKREDIGTERLALWGGRWNECVCGKSQRVHMAVHLTS